VDQAATINARLRLSLLGGFSLVTSGGDHIPIANRKACGLLAYLVLNRGQAESRERLVGLFWSERGEAQARASLRQCLKQLRELFDEIGFCGFKTERQEVVLVADLVEVDLFEAEDHLARDSVLDVLTIAAGAPENILYGYETLDRSFAAWLHVIRRNWHDRLVDKLQSCLETAAPGVAKLAADALINIDPTHEEAHRHLIGYHADSGNTPAALKQYNALWEFLDREFDMEPDEKTQALIADIKIGSYETKRETRSLIAANPRASSSPGGQTRNRLPVLGIWNFVQAGPWNHETYLIDGFRRELIASLVRFREWVVVEGESRHNTIGFSGDQRYAHVDYQLEGTYLDDADTPYLVITLKERVSQRYIWSERITLVLDKWFSVQQDIVRRVSVALNVYLSVERLSRISSDSGMSLDIYDRWLRGQELTLQWRPNAHREAKSIFRSIIDDSPQFGRAYSSLVQIENAAPLISPGMYRSARKNQEAVDLATEAVLIDPLDSRAQLCLGWAYAINRQYDKAEIYLGLACELNQNDPWTLVSSALGWAYCDKYDQALKLSEQALSLGLNPSRSHWVYQATLHFVGGDYQACVEATELAGEETIINLSAWKAAALYHLGRKSEAEASARIFLCLAQRHWVGSAGENPADILEWLLQCFPIKNKSTLQRFRAGLVGAGLIQPSQ